jgi:MoaA/NifB/PqqE/SkfB family radical SAM enzyme
LPQSIGNLQLKSLDDIVGSTTHEHLQESILDGTYRYCNENQCAYIKAGWWEESVAVTNIEHLRLAIDDSCNLRCPSCRTKLIFHKEGSQFKKRIELADKINNWLRNLIHPCTVHIGSDGDPFASHVYRYFMEHTPQSSMIRYSFQTNALLFEEFHPKIPHVIKNLTELGVSIDGASKDTYEALRLGGSWNKINKNLECISKLKQQ